MKIATVCFLSMLACATLPAQTDSRLTLQPAEPLAEPKFPKAEKSERREHPVRPSRLELKPAADPIYVTEETTRDDSGEWLTHRIPKVDAFSHNADGVALAGYDVVAYFDERAEMGMKEFSRKFGGVMWWFATAEHRTLFDQDPERYVPQYGGFCAYSVGKGYPASADPKTFAISNGKLFLFFDKAARSVWDQSGSSLIRLADRKWQTLHR